jgi:hypothetical protein
MLVRYRPVCRLVGAGVGWTVYGEIVGGVHRGEDFVDGNLVWQSMEQTVEFACHCCVNDISSNRR